jgi:hypothetical protein
MSLSFSNQLVEAFKNKIILKKNLIKRVTLNICLRILLELLVLDYSGPFETTRTLLHSTATTRKGFIFDIVGFPFIILYKTKLKKYYEDMEKVYQIAESSYNDLEKKLTSNFL